MIKSTPTTSPKVRDRSEAKRGEFYKLIKQKLKLRQDADVVDWIKQQGKGYQT